jgi:CRP-like cAMP-binding protein
MGLTRETVSRRLSAYQSEGIILLQGSRKLVVQDLARLKEMIE